MVLWSLVSFCRLSGYVFLSFSGELSLAIESELISSQMLRTHSFASSEVSAFSCSFTQGNSAKKMQPFSECREHFLMFCRSQMFSGSASHPLSSYSISSPLLILKKDFTSKDFTYFTMRFRHRYPYLYREQLFLLVWMACWFSQNSLRDKVRVLFRERVLFQFYRKDSLLLEISEISYGVSAEFLTIQLHSLTRSSLSCAFISLKLSRFLTAASVKELPNSFLRFLQTFLIWARSHCINSLMSERSLRCAYIFSLWMDVSKHCPIILISSAIFLMKKSGANSLPCSPSRLFLLNLMTLVQQKQQISSKLASKMFLRTYLLIFPKARSFSMICAQMALMASQSQDLFSRLRSISLKVSTNNFFTNIISMLLISPYSSPRLSRFILPLIPRQSFVSLSNISSKRLFLMNSIQLQVPRMSRASFHLSRYLNVCSVMCLKQLRKRTRQYCSAFSLTGISVNSQRTRRMSRWNCRYTLLDRKTVSILDITSSSLLISMFTSSSSSFSDSRKQESTLEMISSSYRQMSTLRMAMEATNSLSSLVHSLKILHRSCRCSTIFLSQKAVRLLLKLPQYLCTYWYTLSWYSFTNSSRKALACSFTSQQFRISFRLRLRLSRFFLNSCFTCSLLSTTHPQNSLPAISCIFICLVSYLQRRLSMFLLILIRCGLWYSLPMVAALFSFLMMVWMSRISILFCSTFMLTVLPSSWILMQPGSASTSWNSEHLQISMTSGLSILPNQKQQSELKSQGYTTSSPRKSLSSCEKMRVLQEMIKQHPFVSFNNSVLLLIDYLLHCSAIFGKQMNEKNPSAVKSDSKERQRAAVEAILPDWGEEARLEIFLFRDWRLEGASFLGLGWICRSEVAWFHSLQLMRRLMLATQRSLVALSSALSSQMRFLVTSSNCSSSTIFTFLISWMGMLFFTYSRVSSAQQDTVSSIRIKQRFCQIDSSPEERLSRYPRVLRACPITFQLYYSITTLLIYKNYHGQGRGRGRVGGGGVGVGAGRVQIGPR